MFRRVVVLLAVIGTVGMYGCRKADLSRGKAEALISQSSDFQNLRKAIVFHGEGYQKGIRQGMWKDEFQRGWHVGVLTDKGKRYFSEIAQVPMSNNRAGAPVTEVKVPSVKVTGIAKEGDTQRAADFSWTYVDLPSVVKRFAVAGGLGKAQFKLFDDGWRLEHLELGVSDEPASLSDKEKAEEQADAKVESDRIAAIAAQKARRLEEARRSGRELGRFPTCQLPVSAYDRNKSVVMVDLVVTEADVAGSREYRGYTGVHPFRVWFGDITAMGAYDGLEFRADPCPSMLRVQTKNQVSLDNQLLEIYFKDQQTRDGALGTLRSSLEEWRKRFPDLQ